MAGRITEEGRAVILIINKWDAVEKNAFTIYEYQKDLMSRLYFMEWAEMMFVSAMTGQRVQNILDAVEKAHTEYSRRVSTAVINEVLEEAVSWHSPPTTRQGKQGKIYYGTQVTTQPPTIALFVNDPKRFNENYKRYIESQFRKQLGFKGTPIRLVWRGKKVRENEPGPNRAAKV